MQEGWVCPKCGRVNAPWVLGCPCAIPNAITVPIVYPVYPTIFPPYPCQPTYPPFYQPPYYIDVICKDGTSNVCGCKTEVK